MASCLIDTVDVLAKSTGTLKQCGTPPAVRHISAKLIRQTETKRAEDTSYNSHWSVA